MSRSVLLIFPKTGFDLKNISIQMPMGLMCIAAPLVQEGYKVTVLDQRIEKYFFRKVRQCLSNNHVCVGITTMTGSQILYALQIAKFIRTISHIPIIWGGNHPTLMADQTIRNENVDVVVRGEGEITFPELVNNLYLRKPINDINGISWRDGETIYHNPERDFCDLDGLTPIPYDLIDVEKYILSQVPGRRRSLEVYTSRGCPSNCIFCYNKSFNKSCYRKKNINAVIQEIEYLAKKYDLDSIVINDDNFFVDTERTHYFCKCLIAKKVIQGWGCLGVRIDSLEKINFGLLEESGCKQLYIGIESGSEKILNYIKKNININRIKDIINKFSGLEIIAHYNFMVGYPIEDQDDLFDTVELASYIMKTDPKAYLSSFHLITPYPGTEFYDIVQQYGFMPPRTLDKWANIRWETENAAWIPPKMRKIDLNLTLLTYFIDRKGLDRVGHNILLKIFFKILMILAQWHWRYRKFQFCPEFALLNRLMNYKIASEAEKDILNRL